MQRTPKEIRRRGEAFPFRQHLLQLRHEMGWSQLQLALVLGISARTLSHWEMAHWLPPHKQRVHILLKLHDAPPERVLAIADALGVSRDPIVERFLQPYVDAIEGATVNEAESTPEPVAAPAAPPPPRPSIAEVRAAIDPLVREAADVLDARPNDVRALVTRIAAGCGALGGTLDELAAALAPTKASTKTKGAD